MPKRKLNPTLIKKIYSKPSTKSLNLKHNPHLKDKVSPKIKSILLSKIIITSKLLRKIKIIGRKLKTPIPG